jgi:hypothetical protein
VFLGISLRARVRSMRLDGGVRFAAAAQALKKISRSALK